jgi:hypothetical protein
MANHDAVVAATAESMTHTGSSEGIEKLMTQILSDPAGE